MMTNTMRARVREMALGYAAQLQTNARLTRAEAAAQIVAAARVFEEYLSGGTPAINDLDRIGVQVEDFVAREGGTIPSPGGSFKDFGVNGADETLPGEDMLPVVNGFESHDESSPDCVDSSRMNDDDGAVMAPSSNVAANGASA
ncbi:hypothetical protein HLH34_04305 [Gluconacetobacter azotocaptans]|uniref:Uncharacterized protein n=1 Tax=Gluconacetobacter azotocaptans TaxID=142834 RepID=A0A7W4JQR5_9PROT|nr:hypothetical protein [Gluconacetobacter azotocaptans]MBB2189186.1 hypothetical protein [Gluconacetobacter azotocaptans]GBQ32183.1 hypothetical protein AA13594_2294 [Gluconacetobacter azotocaptans DSM 13594]